MRLQKHLAACGVASRRACEVLIAEGRVTVNGKTATVGQSVEPGQDVILLNGKPVRPEAPVYILLNKPVGYITTSQDTHDRKTVLELLGPLGARVFPVGRLDLDAEGLLLLTNDGELSNRLMHPRYAIEKVYLVWVKGSVEDAAVRKLSTGVELDDGITGPAVAKVLRKGKRGSKLQLLLREGRKREIKRMCAAVGHPVERLKRIALAGLRLHGLPVGRWRHLEPREVEDLYQRTGMRRGAPTRPT